MSVSIFKLFGNGKKLPNGVKIFIASPHKREKKHQKNFLNFFLEIRSLIIYESRVSKFRLYV